MTQKSNSRDLKSIAAFAAAISAATGRVNDFSTRLVTLSKVSGMAALQIAQLSTTAAQMIALGQPITTCCQCSATALPQATSNTRAYLETADQAFIMSTAVLAGAKLWAEAAKWFWRVVVAPIGAGGATAIGRIVIPLWRATYASDALAAVIEPVGEFIGAATALVVGTPLATIAAGAALLAGSTYLIWRNWSTIVSTLRTLGAAISREAMTIIRNAASIVAGQPEPYSNKESDPDTDGPASLNRTRHRYDLTSSRWSSLVAAAFRFPPPAFMTEEPQTGNGPRPLTTPLRRTATALLAVPLLVTPTLASVPLERPEMDSRNAISVTVNSSPTIVINSDEPERIEHQVLEALRQHREALYDNWHSELRRRQRTEF